MGSGKSTFSREVASAGDGEHLDADQIAKQLMNPGHAAYQPVVEEFGTYITDEQGYVQPDRLAEEVFTDSDKLSRLESILHPLVKQEIDRTIREARRSFYVVDAPLLFEAGVDNLCDWIVVVVADEDRVIERLGDRGFTREEVERRRSRQLSEEEKIRRADEVIENNGSLEELKRKAREVLNRIKQRNFSDAGAGDNSG